MLNGPKDYLLIGACFAIVLIVAFFKLQISWLTNERDELRLQNEQMKQSLMNQNNALKALKIGYKQQEKKLEQAQDEANDIAEESKKKATRLMNQMVSPECDKAIEWAIKEGQSFN